MHPTDQMPWASTTQIKTTQKVAHAVLRLPTLRDDDSQTFRVCLLLISARCLFGRPCHFTPIKVASLRL